MAELKLGKLPPKIDERTIRLSTILKVEQLPLLPLSYDIDEDLGGIVDSRMFNNSQYGDCVIAARAHQTLRFEKYEQGTLINIADQEVVDQYHKETGNLPGWENRGLILLESLKRWRKEGWPVGGKTYTIYAFASVNWKDHEEVKHCIHLLRGVNFGMMVFQTDIDQFNTGEGWHLTDNNGSFRGGHGVYACKYRDAEEAKVMNLLAEQAKVNDGEAWLPRPDVVGYDQKGIWCMTWGVKQFMTWDFWDARCDEVYTIVDNRDSWLGDNSPVDVEKLDAILKEITGETNPGCNLFARLFRV